MTQNELLPVECECMDDCGEFVCVTAAEYAEAHAEADYVLVVPGHRVQPGERGARTVAVSARFAIVAEGWNAPDDELDAASRARLAELKRTQVFEILCQCEQCDALPRAESATIEITLDEWDAIDHATQSVIAGGHLTGEHRVVFRTSGFVVVVN